MFSKSLRQIATLSISTTGSRILGLGRDVLFFSSFGNNVFSSAFIIAFTIPNLFRRLLGEGALSSAFLPIFTKEMQKGNSSAMVLLNQTLTRLLLYFGGSVLVGMSMLFAVSHWAILPESWSIALPMIQLLLPYAPIICIAAIFTASLNCMGKFVIPSFSPILLNLCMIAALILGNLVFKQNSHQLAYTLSFGVLTGGGMQLLLPALQMAANGWRPKLDVSQSAALAQVKLLFLTATGGAAIVQVNVLITRLIAYQLSGEAVSQLYMASRLTELPMGVFSVAIYTVLFPMLARFSAEKNKSAFAETCRNGILMMLAITIPSTIGLAMLSKPILSVLFEWGRFTHNDVLATAPILSVYAISIPLYSLIAYFTRIFHARQNMRTPVKVSFLSLGINVFLSITLMIPFGVVGLAWANVLTSFIQTIVLAGYLNSQNSNLHVYKLLIPFIKIAGASLVMAISILWALEMTQINTTQMSRLMMVLLLGITIVSAAVIYFLLSWLFGLKRYLMK